MRRWKLHAETTPECSRATSAAAHGAHERCGMLCFRLCATGCISSYREIELDRG